MDLFNFIFVVIPLYCIADGARMLMKGNYGEKQLERYSRFTDESVKKSVKPNAIIYISLGVVFLLWDLVDYGKIIVPAWMEIGLMVVIGAILVALVIYNKKTLVVKPGYVGSVQKRR